MFSWKFFKRYIVAFSRRNHGKNILTLFHLFAQFLFTTKKSEQDCYNQKFNVQATSEVVERLKTEDLRKLGNFKKT